MRLLLIRHAPTAETGSILTGRLPGVGLSPTGVELTNSLSECLGDVAPGAVYTSPILRCRQTASILGERWQHKPIVDRAFIEVDFGSWSGRKLSDVRRLKTWRELFVAPERFVFPNGESLRSVQSRTVDRIEALAAKHGRSTVVVVAHADVIRVALVHFLGMPLSLFHRIDVLPASVSVVDLPPSGVPRVPVVNTVPDVGRWR